MNHHDPENRPTSGRDVPPDDRIEALLQLTGPRPGVPEERMERARAATRAHWRNEVGQRSRVRQFRMVASLAAAAVIVLAVGIGLWQRNGMPNDGIVGRVEVAESAVLRLNDDVTVGSKLITGANGLLAVRMSSGHSLRIDGGTIVRVLSDRSLALERGGLYVDSGATGSSVGESLEISTPLGNFRDIGTQFEVRLDPSAVRVRVREGRVEYDGPGTDGEVEAGFEMEVTSDGRTRTLELPTFGDAWSWLEAATPMMDLEGRSAREFLSWVARERGLHLEFADLDLVRAATEIELSGSIEGMTLDQALESVLPTCGLSHRIEGRRLIVRPRAAPEAT